jgi:hypothetical protein
MTAVGTIRCFLLSLSQGPHFFGAVKGTRCHCGRKQAFPEVLAVSIVGSWTSEKLTNGPVISGKIVVWTGPSSTEDYGHASS